MGGEELKWHQLTHNQLMTRQQQDFRHLLIATPTRQDSRKSRSSEEKEKRMSRSRQSSTESSVKLVKVERKGKSGARKDLMLVHTVQLKPTIKAQISGRMASIGISDVVTASVYSEKTRLKKLMMIMIINRKKRRFFTGARN